MAVDYSLVTQRQGVPLQALGGCIQRVLYPHCSSWTADRRVVPFATFCASNDHMFPPVSDANLCSVAVDGVSNGLIDGQLSGIMGLAFQGIANTGALPFWQALINQNQLTNPEFSFFITRFLNDPTAQTEEPGGVLTLGGTNSTFFQGNIDFQPLTLTGSTGGFWLQNVASA